MQLGMINWLAVLAAVVFSMVNGFFWYNPKTFFNIWWKKVGNGKEPGMANMGMVWGLTILAAAVKALFLGFAVNWIAPALGGINGFTGLLTGLIIWFGFIAAPYLTNKLFAGHGFKIWAIEAGNHLLDLLFFGFLFGIWR